MKRLNFYCMNPDCDHLRVEDKPRFLTGSIPQKGRHRLKCSDCKSVYVWEDGKLVQVGTLIMEDVAVA